MTKLIEIEHLIQYGVSVKDAKKLSDKINESLLRDSGEIAWQMIAREILPQFPSFQLHLFLFSCCYPERQQYPYQAAVWFPTDSFIANTNLKKWMQEESFSSVTEFHRWTVSNFSIFWKKIISKLRIQFKREPEQICDLAEGVIFPHWLSGAKLNISDSCFQAPHEKIAIVTQKKDGPLRYYSYGDLDKFSNQIAHNLVIHSFKPGDAIAINMPMTMEAVAIYLGIIKMGGIVVSIADSFSAPEIAVRLQLAQAVAIFTQDIILRDDKQIPLYERVIKATSSRVIVFPVQNNLTVQLRQQDMSWQDFLQASEQDFTTYSANPDNDCNILFSSGTTGTPKAIPWQHINGIKAASDAYLHLNIQPHSILAWPTNLGWMMGPWIIYAAFINQATLALYEGLPKEYEFGKFIQEAKVTILGVIPTLVAEWRQSQCMENLDWSHIELFSSTGECSNADDMFYLMFLAGYKPIIEYCGGTEIGGAYISSTLIEKNCPSVFTSPAMGLDFILLDEKGQPAEQGEVALIPPSIGLSTKLLNTDHYEVYYAGMPIISEGKILRRHGDQVQRYPNGYYALLGRSDDTMNLGGIKISAVEIERTLMGIENIFEVAAIAVFVPSKLVIFAVTREPNLNKVDIKVMMQSRINKNLNPLFKVYDVNFVKELPKTASNKIMRRVLREQYESLNQRIEGD